MVVHNTGPFHRKPDFHADLDSITSFFAQHAAHPLESIEVDVEQLPAEVMGRIRFFKSLLLFSGLRKLRIPQAVLARIKRNPQSESKAIRLLSSVHDLQITWANRDCHLIAVGIFDGISFLPELRTIKMLYVNGYSLEVDPVGPWESLAHSGLRINRKVG